MLPTGRQLADSYLVLRTSVSLHKGPGMESGFPLMERLHAG